MSSCAKIQSVAYLNYLVMTIHIPVHHPNERVTMSHMILPKKPKSKTAVSDENDTLTQVFCN